MSSHVSVSISHIKTLSELRGALYHTVQDWNAGRRIPYWGARKKEYLYQTTCMIVTFSHMWTYLLFFVAFPILWDIAVYELPEFSS